MIGLRDSGKNAIDNYKRAYSDSNFNDLKNMVIIDAVVYNNNPTILIFQEMLKLYPDHDYLYFIYVYDWSIYITIF